jgi:hypothetical protein
LLYWTGDEHGAGELPSSEHSNVAVGSLEANEKLGEVLLPALDGS